MNPVTFRAVTLLAGSIGLLMTIADAKSDEAALHLTLRSRAKSSAEPAATQEVVDWRPQETALIICDMWDDHWCKGASLRVAELAEPMNAMVKIARAKGVFIIHAPSSVTDFYKDTPQRKLALAAPFAKPPAPLSTAERWGTTWCWPDSAREPNLPIDDSDMGCDCPVKCTIRDAWTRQISTIEMAPQDAVTDRGQETYNLLEQRGIKNVILVGVHLNMCVLGRPFGIRQMVKMGKNVALMRDLTDVMYDHRMKPYVDHFTGLDLVVQHVETYWCPSFVSSDLTGRPPFHFKEDHR